MKNAVLATLADTQYPTSKAAKERAERLHEKHYPVARGFGSYDKGRVQNACHCVAMLEDAGHKEAAAKVEDFLNWMCEPAKPAEKKQRTVAEGMAGSH